MLTTAAQIFPERLGSAVWVDVQLRPDVGITFRVARHKSLSADVLLGKRTFGAGGFLDVARRGSMVASFGIGITHEWSGPSLKEGWTPAAVLEVRF